MSYLSTTDTVTLTSDTLSTLRVTSSSGTPLQDGAGGDCFEEVRLTLSFGPIARRPEPIEHNGQIDEAARHRDVGDVHRAWRDNIFVERLWRSIKYEEVYLRGYDSVSEARASIGQYV
jgi:hypothetical protein